MELTGSLLLAANAREDGPEARLEGHLRRCGGFTPSSNSGLRFQKYFAGWRKKPEAQIELDKDALDGWLKLGEPPDPPWAANQIRVGDAALLAERARRMATLAQRSGGVTMDSILVSPLTVGLGAEHPLENGATFDWSIGCPVLPGSSLKGLARWTAVEFDLSPPKGLSIEEIFGEGPEGGDEESELRSIGAGRIVFFDALPVAPVHLTPRVTTPHHGKYYEQSLAFRDRGDWSSDGDWANGPADWHNPVPVPLLAVAPGPDGWVAERQGARAIWRFAVGPRATGRDADLVAFGSEALREGLRLCGAGAAGRVGRGRFAFPRNPLEMG